MPPRPYNFWVYIMASRSLQLYIGFTNNFLHRVTQHKEHRPGTYSARYNIDRLVHWEHFRYVSNAITREKQLKHWTREQKLKPITENNPAWQDLFDSLKDPTSSGR